MPVPRKTRTSGDRRPISSVWRDAVGGPREIEIELTGGVSESAASAKRFLAYVWRETGAVRNARPSRGQAAAHPEHAQWDEDAKSLVHQEWLFYRATIGLCDEQSRKQRGQRLLSPEAVRQSLSVRWSTPQHCFGPSSEVRSLCKPIVFLQKLAQSIMR